MRKVFQPHTIYVDNAFVGFLLNYCHCTTVVISSHTEDIFIFSRYLAYKIGRVQSAGGKEIILIRKARQLGEDLHIRLMFLESFRGTFMWHLQLVSNKKLDLFIRASGGRKIMEDTSKAQSVMGIGEILNGILKNNFSGTDTWVCVTGHAERIVS